MPDPADTRQVTPCSTGRPRWPGVEDHRVEALARDAELQRDAADLRHHDGEDCGVCRILAGCGKLQKARSRLYESQILQVSMRLKALAEISQCIPLHNSKITFFKKFARILPKFSKKFRNFDNFAKFSKICNKKMAKF